MGETKLSDENILVFIWLGYLNKAAQVQNLCFLGEGAFKKINCKNEFDFAAKQIFDKFVAAIFALKTTFLIGSIVINIFFQTKHFNRKKQYKTVTFQ